MKLPQESTVKAVAYAAIALAGIYYVKRFGDFQKAGSELLKPVADGLGKVWANLAHDAPVQLTQAGLILRQKDFDGAYMMKPLQFQALSTMHPDNPTILQMVLGAGNTLREPYRSMLTYNEMILVLPDGKVETGVM